MARRAAKAHDDWFARALAAALDLPEAWEDHPWGETVVKVRKKVFVFLGTPGGDAPGIAVKLTVSHGAALALDGAAPTGYGLGRAGWVSVPASSCDHDLITDLIDESYANVAPKTLVRLLDAARVPDAPAVSEPVAAPRSARRSPQQPRLRS